MTACEEAERGGFDLSLIEESLGHTYEQRWSSNVRGGNCVSNISSLLQP